MTNENNQVDSDRIIRDFCRNHFIFDQDKESLDEYFTGLSVPRDVVDYILENHYDDLLEVIGRTNNLFITIASELSR